MAGSERGICLLSSLVLAWSGIHAPTQVDAQPEPQAPAEVRTHPLSSPGDAAQAGLALSLEFGFFTRTFRPFGEWDRGKVRVSTFELAARYVALDNLEVFLVWPLSQAAVGLHDEEASHEAQSFLRTGNPFAGVRYVPYRDAHWRARLTAAVTAPLASGPSIENAEDVAKWQALRGAVAMHAMVDAWRYAARSLAVVVGGDVERHIGALVLAAEAAVAPLVCVGSSRRCGLGDGGGADVLLQSRVAVAGKWARGARAGVRFGAVWVPTMGGDDAQTSLEPFVRHAFEDMWVEARVMMNLDRPHGFAFSGNGVWAAFLGAGGALGQ